MLGIVLQFDNRLLSGVEVRVKCEAYIKENDFGQGANGPECLFGICCVQFLDAGHY